MPGRMGQPHLKDERGLTYREREVLRLLRETRMTQTEISEELGVSRQRVSEIKAQLTEKGVKL